MDLGVVQNEVKSWGKVNFPGATPTMCVLGVCEEAGELAGVYLKRSEKIRPDRSTVAMEIDAIGDIAIFLIHLCAMRGFDFESVVSKTWSEVKKRDWKNNPKTGI